MAMNENWHMDKKVPLTLAFAMLVQGAAIIWWASGIEHRMAYTEQSVDRVKAEHEAIQREVDDQGRQVVVIVEQMASANKNLESLRADMKETNILLRDLIAKVSGGMRP